MSKKNRNRSNKYLNEINNRDIAIIGVSARFPMANDLNEYWENIENKINCVSKIAKERKEKLNHFFEFIGKESNYKYMEAAYLDNIDLFDNEFFHISPNEANLMDPQQRMFMEIAWSTFEDSGYKIEQLSDQNIGIYMGHISDLDSYQYKEMIQQIDPTQMPTAFTGNLPSITAGRVSKLFNLIGPNITIDSACSSSLVSVAIACQSLRNRSCDIALVGSTRIHLFPFDDINHKIGIESSDYMTRSFDDNSDGSGLGEGAGAILLKPLWKAIVDNDNIYAVMKGCAINQDGNTSSLTAPNPLSQTDLMIKAWKDGSIDPRTISYLETHGTGTKLGDPIEIEAIKNAFSRYTEDKQFCAISTVKSNIGHLYDCSGMAGIIKAIMALKTKVIPASINFTRPNRNFDLCDSPIYINTHNRKWEAENEIRRCGISSFGLNGTNCHIVLEDYNDSLKATAPAYKGEVKILTLSAKTLRDLKAKIEQYVTFLHCNHSEINNFLFTANTGKDINDYKLAIIFKDVPGLLHIMQMIELTEGQWFQGPFVFFNNSKRDKEEFNHPNLEVDSLVRQYVKSKNKHLTAARGICLYYTQGVKINWHDIYARKSVRKISLPTYPFNHKHFWVDIPAIEDEQLTYSMEWENIKKPYLPNITLVHNTILIFGSLDELCNALLEKSSTVIQVCIGSSYKKMDQDKYIISANMEDYYRLFEDIKDRNVGQIIHGFTADQKSMYGNDVKKNMQLGAYSLFYIIKAIFNTGLPGDIDITLITHSANHVTGHEDILYPENASFCGLGKVINKEYSNLTCRCIDVDDSVSVSVLLYELSIKRKDYQVAIRNNKKYFESMKNMQLDSVEDDDIHIRQGGVYMITGGTGKIGLYIAKHLASKKPKHIVLINRTHLPDRALWENLLQIGNDKRLCQIIQNIQQIELSGTRVSCFSADVSSLDDMQRIIDQIHRDCGPIDGIVHAAGLPGKGLLMTKDTDEFEKVMNPKTLGTQIIDQLTRSDKPDFMILFSSGISTIGEIGQGDYTAANCFLDTYTYYRNQAGLKTTTINWVVWKNTRMMDGKSVIIDGIFKELPVDKALDTFDLILNKRIERVFVGAINSESKNINSYLGDIPFDVPQQIKAIINKKPVQSEASVKYTLDGRLDNSYTDIENIIGRLYKKILGYDKYNIYDNFFEIGGNSIQISQLYSELQKLFPGKIKISDLFQYTTIFKLSEFLSLENLDQPVLTTSFERDNAADEIAIIGMAVKLPGANTLQAYWENIINGIDCSKKITQNRKQYIDKYLKIIGSDFSKAKYMICSYLDNIDEFDYKFFQISPKEAKRMDPSQRLFLQTAWHALEDSGYGRQALSGSKTGVYLGYANIYKDSYQKMIYDISPDYFEGAVAANLSAIIPARISYVLNLKGPSMIVDTACSSSLLSVHLACNAIKNGDCDMAIAGGMKLFILPVEDTRFYMGIESSDGKTRSFDDNSDGASMGEGVGVIVLKSLAKAQLDGDHIYGIIKGSAVNQDGSSQGITAPNPVAQSEVILQAWENARIDPETIAYYEAHGTATALGDPMEVEGLTQAFKKYTDKKQFCAIGTAKTIVGHLNEGSGIAGLIKAVLIAQHHEIPPNLHFNKPNDKIEFYDSPVYVNTKIRKRENKQLPMRCAVSSFGLSGTNCHMVIEEYANVASEIPTQDAGGPFVFTLSALTDNGLIELLRDYYKFFTLQPIAETLENICYTANNSRGHYTYRMAIIISDIDDMIFKIQHIHCQGLFQVKEPWLYYGYNKSPYSEEADNIKNKQFTMEAEFILKQYESAETWSDTNLSNICELYVKGGHVDWSFLHRFHKPKRVQLPVYPFERTACWISLDHFHKEEDSNLFYAIEWELIRETLERDKEDLGKNKHLLIISDGTRQSTELIDLIASNNQQYTVINRNTLDQECIQVIDCYNLVILMCFDNAKVINCEEALETSQKNGVYQLFNLIQSLIKKQSTKPIDLVLMSDNVYKVTGSEDVVKPQAASLFGLGKVIHKEFGNIECRCFDMDDFTAMKVAINDIYNHGASYQIAFRCGKKYKEILKRIPISEKRSRNISIRENGVYIITGGTGGIGLEIAKYLSNKASVNIILLSRSTYGNEKDEYNFTQARNIIQTNGSSVTTYQVDITDTEGTCKFLEKIRRQFGRIDGVIHGAGITSTKSFTEKNINEFKEVLAPKVKGTWVMDTLTRGDSLDFFVVFSSTATVCYSADQSDYVAANAFLDAYCAYRNSFLNNTIAIHWATWKETGMAHKQKFNIDTIFKAISTKDAVSAFNIVLEKDIDDIVIGEINYHSEMAQLLRKYPFHLSDDIRNQLDLEHSKVRNNKPSKSMDTILHKDGKTYEQIKNTLEAICKECLEITELDEDDNFFELGCDSILLKQIFTKFDQCYPGVIQIADMFEYSTVRKLARHVALLNTDASISETSGTDSDKEIQNILNQIEDGQDDIDQMIDKLINI